MLHWAPHTSSDIASGAFAHPQPTRTGPARDENHFLASSHSTRLSSAFARAKMSVAPGDCISAQARSVDLSVASAHMQLRATGPYQALASRHQPFETQKVIVDKNLEKLQTTGIESLHEESCLNSSRAFLVCSPPTATESIHPTPLMNRVRPLVKAATRTLCPATLSSSSLSCTPTSSFCGHQASLLEETSSTSHVSVGSHFSGMPRRRTPFMDSAPSLQTFEACEFAHPPPSSRRANSRVSTLKPLNKLLVKRRGKEKSQLDFERTPTGAQFYELPTAQLDPRVRSSVSLPAQPTGQLRVTVDRKKLQAREAKTMRDRKAKVLDQSYPLEPMDLQPSTHSLTEKGFRPMRHPQNRSSTKRSSNLSGNRLEVDNVIFSGSIVFQKNVLINRHTAQILSPHPRLVSRSSSIETGLDSSAQGMESVVQALNRIGPPGKALTTSDCSMVSSEAIEPNLASCDPHPNTLPCKSSLRIPSGQQTLDRSPSKYASISSLSRFITIEDSLRATGFDDQLSTSAPSIMTGQSLAGLDESELEEEEEMVSTMVRMLRIAPPPKASHPFKSTQASSPYDHNTSSSNSFEPGFPESAEVGHEQARVSEMHESRNINEELDGREDQVLSRRSSFRSLVGVDGDEVGEFEMPKWPTITSTTQSPFDPSSLSGDLYRPNECSISSSLPVLKAERIVFKRVHNPLKVV
ncbi:hypothetical protein CROQUDRAFT_574418 [Cronartium quercuum f. sp. fusiforme G11]|uniref:Uncharacterized protein n=1 Tax=Cronartium quercuum f. sp. fusiforme G11 TaxID=708437 RepID=A0A9P6NXE5_9BASI|nr:hypothetical protein CROQUDRAFT_574418 [Cronartium quercuum f. sp. fusiforme G11]